MRDELVLQIQLYYIAPLFISQHRKAKVIDEVDNSAKVHYDDDDGKNMSKPQNPQNGAWK